MHPPAGPICDKTGILKDQMKYNLIDDAYYIQKSSEYESNSLNG